MVVIWIDWWINNLNNSIRYSIIFSARRNYMCLRWCLIEFFECKWNCFNFKFQGKKKAQVNFFIFCIRDMTRFELERSWNWFLKILDFELDWKVDFNHLIYRVWPYPKTASVYGHGYPGMTAPRNWCFTFGTRWTKNLAGFWYSLSCVI